MIPAVHGMATTMIKRMDMPILERTCFSSFCAKAAASAGTQDAASAVEMEIGTLVRTLYLPEKMPHHSETSAAEYPCIVAMFLNNH